MQEWRILVGDVREKLRELPDGSVQTCVTSPPYFGLRDYGSAGQIGLEATTADYVAALVRVFDEVSRVLADDGTVWINLGDSYVSNGRYESDQSTYVGDLGKYAHRDPRKGARVIGVKPKDLFGIPWMVAFALRDAGWYLRADIIWSKPNPMPESVMDRPTKAHEYLFLLSKRASYYYDAEAIAEPASAAMLMQMDQGYDGLGLKDYEGAGVQNPSSVKARIIENAQKKYAEKKRGQCHDNTGNVGLDDRWGKERRAGMVTRNRRSVWHVATQPYPEAHFATYPEKLIEPCILAGSRVGDTVLDPFCGSGTTGAVAVKHGRSFIGVELNPAYVELARTRIGNAGPLFAQERTA